jgi:thiol-disulfide isomerase/thioredoxin
MKMLNFIAVSLLIFSTLQSRAQQLTISPEFPERGQAVTIAFMPASPTDTQQINKSDTAVTMVFTFSNLYDIPYRLPMTKKGDRWEASFTLARYATYATFVLESGKKVQQPAKDKHYGLPIYENGRRIFSGYLYESYSIPAAMGKDPRVPELQAVLLQKELELHPDNYEAKVRLLQNKMNASTGDEKQKYWKQALDVIAANFYKDPGNAGLTNKTTMGYLIIGEKTRVDSIRKVIREKYPNTEAGYEMQISEIEQITDREERRKAAVALLKKTSAGNLRYVNELHEILLQCYAEAKDVHNALYHLKMIKADTSPYRGEALLKRAELLLKNEVLLDTALRYTDRAFLIAESFPAGLIRYFPETGHILPYVEPAKKKQVADAARGNSLSLKALILQQMGDNEKALSTLSDALAYSSDSKTLWNASWYYRKAGDYKSAYGLTKKLVMDKQEDTAAQRYMKSDYISWNKTTEGWEKEFKEVTDYWRVKITSVLKKERMNKKTPVFERLVNLNGQPVPASAMEGKIVVVDFWATWCVPCMKEMPYLQAVYDKYKDNPKVMFMVINTGSDNTLADAQKWNGNKKYGFPVYYTDEKKLGERFGFNVIPSTFIINPDGYIQFRNVGFEGPAVEHTLKTAIDLLLEELPGQP